MGYRQRRFDVRPIPSAICPCESVLPIRLRPDFLVFSKGFVVQAEHRPVYFWAKNRSLGLIFSEPDDCAILVNCLQGAVSK